MATPNGTSYLYSTSSKLSYITITNVSFACVGDISGTTYLISDVISLTILSCNAVGTILAILLCDNCGAYSVSSDTSSD